MAETLYRLGHNVTYIQFMALSSTLLPARPSNTVYGTNNPRPTTIFDSFHDLPLPGEPKTTASDSYKSPYCEDAPEEKMKT
jgi:hypothetical protein